MIFFLFNFERFRIGPRFPFFFNSHCICIISLIIIIMNPPYQKHLLQFRGLILPLISAVLISQLVVLLVITPPM